MIRSSGIAFVGPKRSGKTTTCDLLASIYGAKKVGFKDALNEEIASTLSAGDFGLKTRILREMNDPALKAFWRPLQQWWGTEYRREWSGEPEYWVDRLEEAVNRLMFWVERTDDLLLIVNDDTRYPNEYERLKKLGFFFVRLLPNPDDDDESGLIGHSSEKYWPTFTVDLELPWMDPMDRVQKIMATLSQEALVAS